MVDASSLSFAIFDEKCAIGTGIIQDGKKFDQLSFKYIFFDQFYDTME